MSLDQAQQRAEQIVETHFSVNSDDLDWLRQRIAAELLAVQRDIVEAVEKLDVCEPEMEKVLQAIRGETK